MPKIQTFTIPGRLAGLNEYTLANRANRFAGSKAKRANQNLVVQAIKAAGLEPMATPVNVYIFWREAPKRKGARLRDKDNIQHGVKYILDALAETGIIKDDGFDDIGYISHDCERAEEPSIEVTISEVI